MYINKKYGYYQGGIRMKNAKGIVYFIGFMSVSLCGVLLYNCSNTLLSKNFKNDVSKNTMYRDGYPVNDNGETYGTINKDSVIEPDLQLTSSGGYIKKSDLDDNVQTLEEALLHNKEAEKGRKIPLYESDGKTVIGEFCIGTGG